MRTRISKVVMCVATFMLLLMSAIPHHHHCTEADTFSHIDYICFADDGIIEREACGNDASAYRATIVYSLISTCKAVDVDPRTWMEDVLRKIPYYQRDQRDLAELLPFNWKNRYE